MPTEVRKTPFEGVVVIIPKRFGDNQGFFEEIWVAKEPKVEGIKLSLFHDSYSFSATVGALCGLHFQMHLHALDCYGGVSWDSMSSARPLALGSEAVLLEEDSFPLESSDFRLPFTCEVSS